MFLTAVVLADKINFYGDVNDLLSKKESAVVISNHQSDVDWAAILMLAARQSPSGHESGLVFTMKDTIRFFPLFGCEDMFMSAVLESSLPSL
ncbi:acyltransferase domain-containing protein [Ditylenchus destructor]|nr:acyltransferase domain-containing protein [Ditylenchus destructor]